MTFFAAERPSFSGGILQPLAASGANPPATRRELDARPLHQRERQ
jgi:hypothetical protein